MATFNDLPRELRDKVYACLFVSSKPINLATDIASGVAGHLTLPVEMHNIGRISSAFKEEATEVYFRDNTFSLTPPARGYKEHLATQLPRWRWTVGVGYCLHHIRNIEIELSYDHVIRKGDEVQYREEKSLYTIRMNNVCYVTRTGNGGLASYCVCELERDLAKLMDGIGAYHGEALLDVATPLLEAADAGECLREEQCAVCGKVKIMPS